MRPSRLRQKKKYYSQFPKYFPKILRGNTFDNKKKLFLFPFVSQTEISVLCIFFTFIFNNPLRCVRQNIMRQRNVTCLRSVQMLHALDQTRRVMEAQPVIQPCATARVLKGAVKGSSAERSPRCKTTGSHHVKLKQMLIMWLSLSLRKKSSSYCGRALSRRCNWSIAGL